MNAERFAATLRPLRQPVHPKVLAIWAGAALLIVALLAGCALMPEWRVFQAKVDPKLAEKPAEQVEAERRAAAFIRETSARPAADPVAQVATIHSVAVPLASSLGEPKVAATAADKDRIIAELRHGVLAEQRNAEQWKAFARKYASKPLEDTGINLAGPAGLLFLVGIVAACIFVPGFGYVLLRLLPVLWSALTRAVGLVEKVATEAPAAVAKFKSTLPQREDAARKAVRLAKRRAIPAPPTVAA